MWKSSYFPEFIMLTGLKVGENVDKLEFLEMPEDDFVSWKPQFTYFLIATLRNMAKNKPPYMVWHPTELAKDMTSMEAD